MIDFLVNVHSVFRWVVLLAAVAAIAVAAMSAFGNRRWNVLSDRSSLFFTTAMDIQFLIGLVIWVLEQRWTLDTGLGWLHPLAMLAAVALAHVGKARSDRDTTSEQKGRAATMFYAASLIVVLVAIPIYSWPL